MASGNEMLLRLMSVVQDKNTQTITNSKSNEYGTGSYAVLGSLPPEVLEHILRYLTSKDLRQSCRLVNRLLRVAATSVLRSRKNERIFATLKRPCKDLIMLDLDLHQYNFRVLNGINICRNKEKCCIKDQNYRRVAANYLSERLGTDGPWIKFISIDGTWNDRCPAWNMVQKLLTMAAPSLEHFSLKSNDACDLFNDLLFTLPHSRKRQRDADQSVIFPSLKSIKMMAYRGMTTTEKSLLVLLTGGAPHLEEIDSEEAYTWNFSEGKNHYYDVLDRKLSMAHYYGASSMSHMIKLVGAQPRNIKKMDLQDTCFYDDAEDNIVRLMRLNSESVVELNCCTFQLAAAVAAHTPQAISFAKLARIGLLVPVRGLSVRLLQRINFGVSFPALQHVEMNEVCFCEEAQVQDVGLHANHELVPCKTATVLGYNTVKEQQKITDFGLFKESFPLVTKMLLCWDFTFDLSFFPDLSTFSVLEILRLEFTCTEAPAGCVDAVLCGLSMEEAQMLQLASNESSELLEDLSYVPMQSALGNMKGLKKLQIELNVDERPIRGRYLSEVSGILALSRLPYGLDVEVSTGLNNLGDARRISSFISQVKIQGFEEDIALSETY